MNKLLHKFSEASKMLSASQEGMRENVYGAYFDHLQDINRDELPEKIRIVYDSVKIRLTAALPYGHIENEDAAYLAKDILYMTDFLQNHYGR